MPEGSVEGVFVDLDNIEKLLTDDIAILVDVPELSAVHIALVNARRYITAAAAIRGGERGMKKAMRPTPCYNVQHYRRELEYTIGVLEKHLELIKRWQHGDDMGQVDSETARFSLANARRYIEYANVRQDNPEQRTIQTLHDMSVRREALIKFYGRVIDYFKDDLLERLIFIQCLAALDSDEGHSLAWLYTDDFNETLIRYQEAKEHDVD